jgi:hypothetical protein
LSDVGHFISDRVFERFTLQVQEQRDLGYRNVVEEVQIVRCSLTDIDTSSMFDVLTVCVTAKAIDYRVSLKDNCLISGNATTAEAFTEFWTLIRRRGAQSIKGKKGLFEGHCPSCGAKVKLNRLGNCDFCDSVIRSGEYDWVLSEITQACVWEPLGRDQLAQAEEYRNTSDPGFSVYHLEDRASVIFWRKAMADRLGELAPLMKVATDEFCSAYEPKLKQGRKGRRYQGNCSVGSISLFRIIRESGTDRCLVCVHYSAHDFHQTRDGSVSDLGNWQRYRCMMVLRRNKGVMSDVSRSLRSAQCPSCGAPETDLASHSCEFCNEVLNQGRFDWVLEEFVPWSSTEADQWLRRSTIEGDISPEDNIGTTAALRSSESPTTNPLDGLAWIIKVLAADGKIHDQEKERLFAYARRNSISPQIVESLLNTEKLADVEGAQPPDRKTARRWLDDMVEMALVDGEISQDERRVLVEVGCSTGLANSDINLLIAKRRAQARRKRRQGHATNA